MTTNVSFELAKLLKEKGFDNPTQDCYNLNGLLFSNGWCEYVAEDSEFDGLIRIEKLKEKDVLAPTIAEVVMWLYEKHNIWMWVEKGVNPDNFYPVIQNHVSFKYSPEHWRDSVTEAYEAAIFHALNNIVL